MNPCLRKPNRTERNLVISLLSFFLTIFLFVAACNDEPKEKKDDKGKTDTTANTNQPSPKASIADTSVLTVASIRESADGRKEEVLFNEKEQIFILNKSDDHDAGFSKQLHVALDSNKVIKVFSDPANGLLKGIATPSEKEMSDFHGLRKQLLKAEKPLPIDVFKIDTSKFNVIDKYLKFPSFKICSKTVPGYATAKQIFDYCAAQSCNLPGPYGVTPCIPFQYVIDGCYARAHKMRWIIENKYHYCCQKVFSFANQGNDRLAVKANKWGGCCVTWWYHVAPLISVRTKFMLGKGGTAIYLNLAYVIDPGMFDQPVLLSTWLQAQKNLNCSSNANVSMYTIQPGSAYTPANFTGTSFTTDPTYSATNTTLTNYRNLTTCH